MGLQLLIDISFHEAEWDDAPVAGDGGSTSMSVLARDDELLVERNNIARLSFPTILLIFLQNRQKATQLVE